MIRLLIGSGSESCSVVGLKDHVKVFLRKTEAEFKKQFKKQKLLSTKIEQADLECVHSPPSVRSIL